MSVFSSASLPQNGHSFSLSPILFFPPRKFLPEVVVHKFSQTFFHKQRNIAYVHRLNSRLVLPCDIEKFQKSLGSNNFPAFSNRRISSAVPMDTENLVLHHGSSQNLGLPVFLSYTIAMSALWEIKPRMILFVLRTG